MTAYRVPSSSFPRVDDQLVRPETREELVRGRAVVAMPAKEPHAECHFMLDFLTAGAVAPGYVGATELLTRAGPRSDFATDTCIRRAGIDPATGGRYLEELAFEIINEQSQRDITERAEDLSNRGVRRLIGIFVKKREVREWSAERNGWIVLDPSSVLEDRTLVHPIPIRALLDRAEADDVVAHALRAKKNPVIMALEAEGHAEGRLHGKLELVLQLLDRRGLGLDDAIRARVSACTDEAQAQRWFDRAITATSLDAVFEEP